MKDSLSISDFLRKSDLSIIESELLDAHMPPKEILAITNVLRKATLDSGDIHISEDELTLLEKMEESLTNTPLFYRNRIGKAVDCLESLSEAA